MNKLLIAAALVLSACAEEKRPAAEPEEKFPTVASSLDGEETEIVNLVEEDTPFHDQSCLIRLDYYRPATDRVPCAGKLHANWFHEKDGARNSVRCAQKAKHWYDRCKIGRFTRSRTWLRDKFKNTWEVARNAAGQELGANYEIIKGTTYYVPQ